MMLFPHADLGDGWTAGAQRALLRAAQMASAHEALEIEPIHLLWSLVFDDGRAGARLDSAGLNASSVQHAAAVLGFLPEAVAGYESAPDCVPWGRAALEIAWAALHDAASQRPKTEAGTEHLLKSLYQSDAALATLLRQQGLEVSEWDGAAVAEPHEPAVWPESFDLPARDPSDVAPAELFRILDAAANRAREGLRVIEDYSRFALNDGFLSRQTKECRHELSEILRQLPQAELLACRDTPGDVGTRVGTISEYCRTHPRDVLVAACKRAQEALRTLEEFGKVLRAPLGIRFEQLRYRLYTLEKAVLRTEFNRERLAEQRLYVLLTEELCPQGTGPVVHAALKSGVRMFQVREKRMKDRELAERCRWLRAVTRDADALLIVNDRPDIAALVDADGVHVGQDELSVSDARRIVGPERLVGVSTHTLAQARQAVLDGADYLGVGPTFSSSTKEFSQLAGLEFVRQAAAEIRLPWFAIGGIHADNIEQVVQAGAERVAVSAAVCSADQPGDAATELLYRL